jgi:hypothetical protein
VLASAAATQPIWERIVSEGVLGAEILDFENHRAQMADRNNSRPLRGHTVDRVGLQDPSSLQVLLDHRAVGTTGRCRFSWRINRPGHYG